MGCGSTKNVDDTPAEKEPTPLPEASKLKAQGDKHFDKKDYDKALDFYTKAFQVDPKYGIALYNQGSCYEHKGLLPEAVKAYQEASNLLVTSAAQKRCYDAENRARKACPKDSGHYKALDHKEKGDAHYDEKKWQEAVLEYTQAIAADNTFASPWYNRGMAYEKMGKLTQAQDSLSQAAKLLKKPDALKACNAALEKIREQLSQKQDSGGGSSGDQTIFLLISSITSTTEQEREQRELANILDGKSIVYLTIDASVSASAKLSTTLRTVSGKSTYPQVFTGIGQCYTYVGDFLTVQKANDEGRLVALLNLPEEDEKEAKGDEKDGNDIEFILRQYKGSKIWKLTRKECEALWNALDRKRDGYLDLNEMRDFAKAFWDAQKERGDERGMYLSEEEAEDHTRQVREALQLHMDTDKDGKLEKDEFIAKWNKVAYDAFSTDETCSVM